MKPKRPKRVRCWMVRVRVSKTVMKYVYLRHSDALFDMNNSESCKITPGYFVPDEPRAKKRGKR